MNGDRFHSKLEIGEPKSKETRRSQGSESSTSVREGS